MTQFSDICTTNATPPVEDLDLRHVQILSANQIREFKTLRKRIDRTPRDPHSVMWQVVGTCDGYTSAQLNALYKAGELRIVSREEQEATLKETTPQRRSLTRYNTRRRHRTPYEDDGYEALQRQFDDESGLTARVEDETRGLNDYKISFENPAHAGTDEQIGQHKHKLIFFRGAGSFQGSLPYYFDSRDSAWSAAGLIAGLMGFLDARGVVGNGQGAKHQDTFQGSIQVRCRHTFDAKDIASEIADILGYGGQIEIHHLGQATRRELSLTIGVRDTKQRTANSAAY